MVTVRGHAYPWDVLGDDAFPSRVGDLGIAGVTLAASYHSVRAATPLHPRHQLVDAPSSALYRPARGDVWESAPFRPRPATWIDDPDPFGTAAAALRESGIPVTAWIVLTHDTSIGSAHPEIAVTNCFGDVYPYALCPANATVRDHATTLAAEAVRDVELDGVSLEACGQLGLTHLGQHEKTDGAWTPYAAQLLSVCCCAACKNDWRHEGGDPDQILHALRRGVHSERRGELFGTPAKLDRQIADLVLKVRHRNTDTLRSQVVAAVREQQPETPITLHASPDPWATGPSPGLTPSAAADVDALLVQAWPTTQESADHVAAATEHGTPAEAYVTVLSPTDPRELKDHVNRLISAGASGFGLYHLGLAPAWRQPQLAEIARLASET